MGRRCLQERSDRQAPAPLELVKFVEQHNWYETGRVVRLAIALEKVLRNPRVCSPARAIRRRGRVLDQHEDPELEELAPTDLELLRLYVRDKTRRDCLRRRWRSTSTPQDLPEENRRVCRASRESIEAWIDAHMAKTDKKRGRKASHATWARRSTG